MFLLPDRLNSVMNTQDFVLIPKSFYTQQKHSTLQVLRDPEVEQKAKSLTLLQRNNTFPDPSTVEKKEKTSKENILVFGYAHSGTKTKNERNFEQN